MALGRAAGLDDLGRARGHHLGGREDQRRVEVALHDAVADERDRLLQRRTPVDADHVGAGLAHQAEQVGGADAEVDARHAELAGRGQHPLRSAASPSAR